MSYGCFGHVVVSGTETQASWRNEWACTARLRARADPRIVAGPRGPPPSRLRSRRISSKSGPGQLCTPFLAVARSASLLERHVKQALRTLVWQRRRLARSRICNETRTPQHTLRGSFPCLRVSWRLLSLRVPSWVLSCMPYKALDRRWLWCSTHSEVIGCNTCTAVGQQSQVPP